MGWTVWDRLSPGTTEEGGVATTPHLLFLYFFSPPKQNGAPLPYRSWYWLCAYEGELMYLSRSMRAAFISPFLIFFFWTSGREGKLDHHSNKDNSTLICPLLLYHHQTLHLSRQFVNELFYPLWASEKDKTENRPFLDQPHAQTIIFLIIPEVCFLFPWTRMDQLKWCIWWSCACNIPKDNFSGQIAKQPDISYFLTPP